MLPNVFKHSDLTNTRDLVRKLNELNPYSEDGSKLFIIEGVYYNDEIIVQPQYAQYSSVLAKLTEGNIVLLRLDIPSTNRQLYLSLHEFEDNYESIPDTLEFKTHVSSENNSIYCYSVSVNSSNVWSINIENISSIRVFDTYTDNEGAFNINATYNEIIGLIEQNVEVFISISDEYEKIYIPASTIVYDSVIFNLTYVIDERLLGITVYITSENVASISIRDFDMNAAFSVNDVSVTYSELTEHIENNTLLTNRYYVITDYVTKTSTSTEYKSAEHPFNIRVRATSGNSVSNEAEVLMPSAADSYFQNCDMNKWKVLYDVNNDTSKYEWADSTNGKGVIYYMKDEFGNECNYDFKNILYKVYKASISGVTLVNGYVSFNSNGSTHVMVADSSDYIWSPTFAVFDENAQAGDTLDDMTVSYANVYNNSLSYTFNYQFELPLVTFIGTSSNQIYDNSFKNCSKISLTGACSSNDYNNVRTCVFMNSVKNTIYNLSNSIAGYSFTQNTIAGGSNDIVGDNFQYNLIENGFNSNTIGNNVSNCTFGNTFQNNVIGNTYKDCKFGNRVTSNSFSSATGNAEVKNIHVSSGIYSFNIDGDDIKGRNYYTFVSKNSNGVIKVYCITDLVL